MEITNYINAHFKAFESQDKIAAIQDFFEEQLFSHFPVVENGVYIGSISSDDAETLDASKKISDFKYLLEPFFTRSTSSWIEVLEGLSRFHSNIIPVLDEDNQYIGYYETEEVVKFFYETPFFRENGQILKIRKNLQDFSMSQIVQIVETNSGKIYGLFLSESTSTDIEVTLKINTGAVNEIIQSFRRYSYEIVSNYEDDNYINILKERSAYLSKYLDM